ncbi:bifunctional aminoglycoside phosphotransferase/ATP-binding protein [Marinobacterium sp. xm-a-152]|uniref:bifunctional aminoglycoside phosphotransferase/ATP-binding protein n=1 Tax=Marinobacterium sp. xm-a-152 TaxID=2497733 RepID=UPI001567F133|nr:bifunctional aminoglycoside phosphotransferase/ATP-binding protein [Marinobacterium sp. xm-a-152]NRP15411.1 Phosphotransferase enzyme family protein [Marinobacterium sp. xm-a-152]
MESTLVNNLLNPACYPHEVSEFEVIETHIAWLIRTGEFVYKIKKPVNFGFLDFTTLEKRKYFCEEELRLNQRLSENTYIEVVAIGGTESDPVIGATGGPIEYAVKMREFASGLLLSELLNVYKFDPNWIDKLADKIADFHQRAPIVAPGSPWGEPDSIAAISEDNYRDIDRSLIPEEDAKELDRLWQHIKDRYQLLEPLMRRRKLDGSIRECHGDLHLGNITLDGDSLLVFDCIEFNLEFRWIDKMSDLGFLLMDLEASGHPRWANRCLNRYMEITGDYEGLILLPYYKAHRAMVRAKVAMLGEKPNLAEFQHYLKLTAEYAAAPLPMLVMMQGISGSGKSHISSKLAELISGVRVRSSAERKKIYRKASREGESLEMYGADMNMRTFLEMKRVSGILLEAGQTLILDAAYIRQRSRRQFLQLAEELGCPARIIACEPPEKVIEARLAKRSEEREDPTDATIEVMQAQKRVAEPLSEEEEKIALHIDTSEENAHLKIIQYLIDQKLLPKTVNCG